MFSFQQFFFFLFRERLGSDCFGQIEAMVNGVAALLEEVKHYFFSNQIVVYLFFYFRINEEVLKLMILLHGNAEIIALSNLFLKTLMFLLN